MKTLRLVFAIVALVGVTACSAPPQQDAAQTQPAATPAATPKEAADQMAQGMQQMAKGLEQMAKAAGNGQAATPVDFAKLQAVLPTVGGWTRGAPEGRSMAMPVAMSMTEASYTKGEMDVKVTITDSMFNSLISAPLMMMMGAGFSERTEHGFKRATTIGGMPAYEEWDGADKDGTVGAIVGKRFIVQATGSHLDSIDTLRGFVDKINFNSLAALK